MPRALWTGTISFGLVNIPVRLLPATRRRNVRFHEIDSVTGQRVHHERVRWPQSEELEREDLIEGLSEVSLGNTAVTSDVLGDAYDKLKGLFHSSDFRRDSTRS